MLRLRAPLFRILYGSLRSTPAGGYAPARAATNASRGSDGGDLTDAGTAGGVGAAATAGQLPARAPLAKNFFVGVVDKELLGFPEVITREEMSNLQNELLPLQQFFAESVDARAIDATRTIPAEMLEAVRQLGLHGGNVPQQYDGRGWNWSASLMASEPETRTVDVALPLASHRSVVDLLREVGTLEQQQRFLPKLAKGSLVGAEALFEYDVPEDEFFNTTAEYDSSNNTWVLKGDKAFVITGPLPADAAPLFVVLAQTQRPNVLGVHGRGTTAFLVAATEPGVKLGEQHLTTGGRGLHTRHVKFDGVKVSEGCVLGESHEGNQVAEVLLRAGRLRGAMVGLGLAKEMMNDLAQYCVRTKQCGGELKDMEMAQTHLSSSMCGVYAMESLVYMTAGLLDEFHKPDVALEAAITKFFTLRELMALGTRTLHMLGPKALHADQTSEMRLRNALHLYTHGESLDTLQLYIALTGLQHAGALMNDAVQKARNPLFHPGHVFGKFLESSSIENPKTKMRLSDNLHPSLEPAAQCIEHSVARLQMSAELLFTRYGNTVVERHGEMVRLADIVTTIYAMFASVSRASRSYCIGLQLADHELLTASAICSNGRDVVKTLSTAIFNGKYVNNDNNLTRLSKQVIKSKGYFPVHPLTYNY